MRSRMHHPTISMFAKHASVSAALFLVCLGNPAQAANYVVSAGTASFDCSAAQPGDTITLAAGSRGPLKISGCTGASGKPIVVRNDVAGSKPTVIQRTTGGAGGFLLHCDECVWTKIDGSGKWAGAPSGKTYGIQVVMAGGGSPGAFVKVSGKSRFLTISGIEVDGKWPSLSSNGIGIDINDHEVKAAANPGLWREGIVIENSYVHDVEGEGMYVGANWFTEDIPLRNIAIRDNIVEDTGWNGINLKSSIGGVNRISSNVVKRAGKKVDSSAGQHSAIAVYEGYATIDNNWVENAGEAGIRQYIEFLPASYGSQLFEVYNNVVVKPGRAGPQPGFGITSNSATGMAPTLPRVYNNTVVGAAADGIKVGSRASDGYVRNNIVVDSTAEAIAAPTTIAVANNLTGTSSSVRFANAASMDYRLQATSPARDAASGAFPATDYAGVARPQDGGADQGAFEFGTADARPEPPSNIVIE